MGCCRSCWGVPAPPMSPVTPARTHREQECETNLSDVVERTPSSPSTALPCYVLSLKKAEALQSTACCCCQERAHTLTHMHTAGWAQTLHPRCKTDGVLTILFNQSTNQSILAAEHSVLLLPGERHTLRRGTHSETWTSEEAHTQKRYTLSLTWTQPGGHKLSILAAKQTVSPNRQNRGHLMPAMPDVTGPCVGRH